MNIPAISAPSTSGEITTTQNQEPRLQPWREVLAPLYFPLREEENLALDFLLLDWYNGRDEAVFGAIMAVYCFVHRQHAGPAQATCGYVFL